MAMVARRYQGFDVCEDAVQEALAAAATQWRADGIPDVRDVPRVAHCRNRSSTASTRNTSSRGLNGFTM